MYSITDESLTKHHLSVLLLLTILTFLRWIS